MALTFIPNLSALSTMLLMVLAVTTSLVLASHEVKETQLSFYFQDIFAGPNATDIPFAGISGKAWTFTEFATLYAIDDPVTEGSHPNSASVGRVQGTSMASALDELNAHVLFSIVFTNKKYNGSTLQIQGIDKQFEPVRELSVVSGTGKFRFVRGPSKLICSYTMQHYGETLLEHHALLCIRSDALVCNNLICSSTLEARDICCWPHLCSVICRAYQ